MIYFGMGQCKDAAYGAASALTYWVFRCRDKQKSPSMGTKTWTFLESSIQNSAETATCLEDYLQTLSDRLISHLRPAELAWVVKPLQRVLRVSVDGSTVQELDRDQESNLIGWRDILEQLKPYGFSEWEVLELCRRKASIIQVLVRLRFEDDRLLGKEVVEEFLEVEAVNV